MKKHKDEFADFLLKEIKEKIIPEFKEFKKYFSALENPSKYYDFNEKEGYAFQKQSLIHNGRLYDYYLLTIPVETPFNEKNFLRKNKGFIPKLIYVSYIFYKDAKNPNIPPVAIKDSYILGTYGEENKTDNKINFNYFIKYYIESQGNNSMKNSIKKIFKNILPGISEEEFLTKLKNKMENADSKIEQIIHFLDGIFFKNFLNPNNESDYENIPLAIVTDGKRKQFIQSLNFLNGYGYYKYYKKDMYRAEYMAMKYIEWIYLDIGEMTFLKGFDEIVKTVQPYGVKDSSPAFAKVFGDILFDARFTRDVSYELYNTYFGKLYEMNSNKLIKEQELRNILKKLMFPLQKSVKHIKEHKHTMTANIYLNEENVVKLYEKAQSLFSEKEIEKYESIFFTISPSLKEDFKNFISDKKTFSKYFAEFSSSEKGYLPENKKLTGPGRFIPADKGPLCEYIKYMEYVSLINSRKDVSFIKKRIKNDREKQL